MKKFLLLIACALVSIFFMTTTTGKNIEPIDVNKLMSGERELTVGHIDFPPFYLTNNTGIDADILREVAKQAGISKVKFVLFNNLPELFAGINNGKIDIIANGIVETPERAAHYLFTKSYLPGGIALLYFKSTGNIQSAKDLIGYKIGTLRGSYPVVWAKKNGVPEKSIMTYENFPELLNAFKQKQIDVLISNYHVALYQQKLNYAPMQVVLVQPKPLVYLLRKQDLSLQTKLNSAIDVLLSNKTITTIDNKYMGSTMMDHE